MAKYLWVTDGSNLKKIDPDELNYYLSIGYRRGKKLDGKSIQAWNKGLTVDNDKRVKTYVAKKPKKYKKKTICFKNGHILVFDEQKVGTRYDSNGQLIDTTV